MRDTALRLALLSLAMVSAATWGQSKNIHEDVDPYSGLRTLYLEVPTRACPGDKKPSEHDPDVHLLITATENKDGSVAFFITPELDGGSTLNLRAKGTMDVILDGGPVVFTTPMGSTVTTRYYGERSYRHETVPFLVTHDDLLRLSNTDWIQFRVNGPRQTVQRCSEDKRLRDLPEFLGAASDYVATRPSTPPQLRHLVESVNPSTHLRDLKLVYIPTQSCPGDATLTPRDADVHLEISANQRPDGGVWYYITTELANSPTLGLRRGDQIETEIDGKRGTFNTINGSTLTAGPEVYSVPHERIAFHVHQANLIALSRASLFEFRVGGPNQTVHRCTTAKYLVDLPRFIAASAALIDAEPHSP
jgi:hypothetical protein